MRSASWLLPILVLASGCAGSLSSQCLPEPPRVASRADGVPETIWEGRAKLLKLGPKRYCQALVEAPFCLGAAVRPRFGGALVSVLP